MPEPADIEVYKALADDTRYRLFRYLRLSGRPVSIRELAVRLSLHPNTLRPHLRRLEQVGLVASQPQKDASVGRPQTVYAAVEREERAGRDYRLLADILSGLWGKIRERADEFLDRRTVETDGLDAATRDFVAGMTDRYAIRLFEQLFIPKPWATE